MASVTVALTGFSATNSKISWGDDVDLGNIFSVAGDQLLSLVELNDIGIVGRVFISISGSDNRFTAAFEATGRPIFAASDGETLEVMIANADMTEPYGWTPSNSAEVVAFVSHVRGLADQNATLTLTDDPAVTAHAVDAGAVSWAFDLPQPTVTHTAHVADDHDVDAGNVVWAFALPQPTVTHTPAPGTLLLLADFDNTGSDC